MEEQSEVVSDGAIASPIQCNADMRPADGTPFSPQQKKKGI